MDIVKHLREVSLCCCLHRVELTSNQSVPSRMGSTWRRDDPTGIGRSKQECHTGASRLFKSDSLRRHKQCSRHSSCGVISNGSQSF